MIIEIRSLHNNHVWKISISLIPIIAVYYYMLSKAVMLLCYYTYTDIKECEIGTNNCSQVCIELPGAFECSCYYGYRLQADTTTCEGIASYCVSKLHH